MSKLHWSELLERYRKRRWRIATAESCTGGLVAAAMTAVPGSSDVFDRGWITYSNESKSELLGVSGDMIARHGAVSAEVAIAMAVGALQQSNATVAISVTGIAGPGGGSVAKPVGLVYLSLKKLNAKARVERHLFPGSRAKVRNAALRRAFEMLADVV